MLMSRMKHIVPH